MLFDVFVPPGRFCQKYFSCGGRSRGGVGLRCFFFVLPLGLPRPRFVGVSGTAAASGAAAVSWSSASSSASSSSQICRARASSSSMPSSLWSPSMSRCSNLRALFRRADLSAFLTIVGVPLGVSSSSSSCFVGVANRTLRCDFGVTAPLISSSSLARARLLFNFSVAV